MTVTHRFRRALRAAPAVLVLGLGACAGVSEKDVADGSAIVTPATQPNQTADVYKRDTYCPPIQIRAGTATMEVYERGHEKDQNYVRYLASITQTARECTMVGGTLTIKVGVAGRVVAGPKGSAANVTLPVRVAVAKQFGGTGPLYSQLFKIPVSLTAPTFGANYNHVFDQVTVTIGPQDRNLIVFVGFDEGPGA